jgi:predicted DNA-binding protein with PD1-like motif
MEIRDVEKGFVIKLSRGEELMSTLTSFCETRGIQSGVFSGIGAVEHVTIGYYDLNTREYFFREEKGVFEVASMQGNVALVDSAPFIHAHAVLSRCDESLECIGAHIKEATVAVTLEIFLTPFDVVLRREMDETIGLKLLKL